MIPNEFHFNCHKYLEKKLLYAIIVQLHIQLLPNAMEIITTILVLTK